MSRGGKPPFNWGGRSFQQQKQKPLLAIDRNDQNTSGRTSNLVISTDLEPGCFIVGWKLYFPNKDFKESVDIVRRIKAMEKHFNVYNHWYDLDEVSQTCSLKFDIQRLESDEEIEEDWPDIYDELRMRPTITLACIGLAMHNLIIQKREKNIDKDETVFQHPKIYTVPINFKTPFNFEKAAKASGQLVRVTGTVIHEEPIKGLCKMACFKCEMCGTELVVKQTSTSSYIYPSSCKKGCPARGNFRLINSSPYSIFQSKQMIRLRESICVGNRQVQTLDVELIQSFAATATLGMTVNVTGVMKYMDDNKSNSFLKKNETRTMKTYLKCLNLEVVNKSSSLKSSMISNNEMDFLNSMKGVKSPFRLMVHSLCPSIFGREEVKAGLILALLSGGDFMKKRRSESHILLVGNPGAGKSKLLQACAEVSHKGIFVSGPTSTAVGLTASVAKNGAMDAGSLVLANGGACCIDEFDKMSSHSHVLLESMEQQMISISKCGVKTNLATRVVIIAAANPIGSIYDRTKTMKENVKIPIPLLSRFDLIFTMTEQKRTTDDQFLAHISNRSRPRSATGSSSFFSNSSFTNLPEVNRNNIKWLNAQRGETIEPIPAELLKIYIQFARDNVNPKLSEEAIEEIRNFFVQLRKLTYDANTQPVTNRQLEALMRLGMSRARADREDLVTREHIIDVINIFKLTMTEIFADEDDLAGGSSALNKKKSKAQNVSIMSKAKQITAFRDAINDEVESQNRNDFTRAELKAIANEIGVKEFDQIIDTINHHGYIIKTAEGFRVT